jgi:hypothetical protein
MPLSRIARFLSRSSLFVYGCYWLMALVVVGTLAQRDLGLYAAQKKYFSSLWIPVWGIPLPGGRVTMLFIFVNLTALFIRDFNLSLRRLGITVTHFGALVLLVGGFVTARFASEGSVVIPEGESAAFVSDYHERELAIIDTEPDGYDLVTAFGDGRLREGARLRHESCPGEIEIVAAYENCLPVRRTGPAPPESRGFLERFALEPLPTDPEDERNRMGIVFRLTDAGEAADGLHALFEHQAVVPTLSTSAGERTFVLRRERRYLPFALELIDFEKQLHPGTGMARSYRSVVHLVEDGAKRRVVIQMNEPLRHRGYTFFQSSFIEDGSSQTTVLAAVKNVGWTVPYVASLIMCIGLLVHLVLKVPGLIGTSPGVKRS